MLVHANLTPKKAFVREDVLFNMDKSKAGNYLPCQIISVSSYPKSVPTFQVIIDKESLFSYIPPHLIGLKVPTRLLELSDLVYHNCPEAEFSFVEIDYLKHCQTISAFIKSLNQWMKCDYWFSMDWYLGNDLLHCVILENGQPAFLPSHKLSLNDKREFPPYLKLKQEWKV